MVYNLTIYYLILTTRFIRHLRCEADIDDIPDFFANNAGVLLEGGNDLFAGNAKGFLRLNLAMPRSLIKIGVERMVMVIEKYKREK